MRRDHSRQCDDGMNQKKKDDGGFQGSDQARNHARWVLIGRTAGM